MKKHIFFIFYLIIFIVNIYSIELTKEILINNSWEFYNPFSIYPNILKFNNDLTYCISVGGEGVTGKYIIKNNVLYLCDDIYKDYNENLEQLKYKNYYKQYELKESDNSTLYKVCLHRKTNLLKNFDEFIQSNYLLLFYNINEKFKINEKFIYNNIKIKLVNQYEAISLENINMRELPFLNSNEIIIVEKDNIKYKYLPKGRNIFVIGKTENKFKILNYINYCYLVKIQLEKNEALAPLKDFENIYYQDINVWVYGEFIKDKK